MERIASKLSLLRGLFIAYFAALLLVDLVLGWDLTRAVFEGGPAGWPGRLRMSHGAFIALTLSIAAVLFFLGLWLLLQAARRKNWARVALLVVGWLIVIDALTSLLFTSRTPGFSSWLSGLNPDMDWHRAMLIDRIKDFLGLLYWGTLIFVLQFNAEMKRGLLEPARSPRESGPGTPGPGGPEGRP